MPGHRLVRRFAGCCAALLTAWIGVVPSRAQTPDYPTQRITIVVAFAPGGSVDAAARIIAEKLHERWNEPVVVENRLGAAGNIAAAAVSHAAPDGYTLLMTASGVAINQALYENPGYSIKDLQPIVLPAVNSSLLAVNADNPAHGLKEFFDQHREKGFVYGTSGVGSGAHITAAYLFQELAKVQTVLTPFQGGAPALTAVMGNHIDLASVAVPDAAALIQQGKLRALAVSGAERSEALPDVPTFSESGFPGFVTYGWTALLLPAKADTRIAEKLNAAINDILAQPDVKTRLDAVGFTVNRESLADTTKRLDADLDKWRMMVAALGMKIK
jgi:tripartite-type tricarboxylate transporter receptor subunit TctC